MNLPNRTEIIERLRKKANAFGAYGLDVRDLMHEAADLLEAGESRVEYRVVRSDGLPGAPHSEALENIEAHRRALEDEDGQTYRIQQHTVTETPWVDVEEG